MTFLSLFFPIRLFLDKSQGFNARFDGIVAQVEDLASMFSCVREWIWKYFFFMLMSSTRVEYLLNGVLPLCFTSGW